MTVGTEQPNYLLSLEYCLTNIIEPFRGLKCWYKKTGSISDINSQQELDREWTILQAKKDLKFSYSFWIVSLSCFSNFLLNSNLITNFSIRLLITLIQIFSGTFWATVNYRCLNTMYSHKQFHCGATSPLKSRCS